jgi:hypothetical protein
VCVLRKKEKKMNGEERERERTRDANGLFFAQNCEYRYFLEIEI